MRRAVSAFALALVLDSALMSTAAQGVAGDWPQFHRTADHLGVQTDEHLIDPSTVASMQLAWTATTGGPIHNSSPAVVDGVVYVGSTDKRLYAYAVGCGSGGSSC